ncbi:MAG: 3D-(3,5/4)-trihydroxycyclohexane-1,2-dione acylhydrolase (decyclizing) [Bosea sp.]|uniref:3D-(3,5/4)-trihydroxycyclohexane-1,2-dione acylhydrolase (decyclizing) n=1 Tax=unclassified Bosea (in: a-proteobacteria) TaxID=2653178 RepID=UPI00095D11CF|nr:MULTISPECIES: 3D-(3,5/4)-trihydroxycyclohexane-1,2-dione acylhydrolase (decyclizing) [unclassified Bosea (in: a-proteobacteria)]MBN9458803.1 3D-(3,5/4)-trihydroxycyclohexane-1,2-dione acylhydrolase (decyclizing) [Bosea sp. (in: a-proteobacteria)]OJV04380.1 MAG: 3D-(3,5/4)-trihydroxycyclohexane-1,2-dione acylhydrolase (decyclizing) [Bosea sp. 67-29]
MTRTIRLTMAQALTRYLAAQMTEIDGQRLPIFGGVWAIFGHGNVAGLGEALWHERERLPTFRAHNEQAMAHAAIAYAKANMRRRFMAATTSIGPGATNLVTAAALAHVNRLPVLLLPGDVFANRIPDPVLQQVEAFGDGTVSANDCFKPVSRYFDRITRPEQIIPALTRAMQVLTDPAECGPVTLALCQDVQAEAYDYPESFFAERIWTPRRPRSDRDELKAAAEALKAAKKPLIVAGGGVLYSGASDELARFSAATGIPVCETQGGKSALPDDDALNMAAVGVTGTEAANRLAAEADLILAVGTRLQDFTTGSWALFGASRKTVIGLNVQPFDAGKHRALPVVADAREGLAELTEAIGNWKAPESWTDNAKAGKADWQKEAGKATAATNAALPSDAQVIGAVQRALGSDVILLHAAGGLPGELHKLWQAGAPGSYHAEYGFSCMGYEIAGGLGAKMARPDKEVVVMVGDGSYLMLNSEIATSVMLGLKLTIVLLDNRGFGCINRLQNATGGQSFNNLLKDTRHETLPEIDFVQHAASMGAIATKAASIAELEAALAQTKANTRTTVVVIDTDPLISTGAGGAWWDVAVPEVSEREQVRTARADYDERRKRQTIGN